MVDLKLHPARVFYCTGKQFDISNNVIGTYEIQEPYRCSCLLAGHILSLALVTGVETFSCLRVDFAWTALFHLS